MACDNFLLFYISLFSSPFLSLQVFISLTGINPELGQTLASTGLTVWRAAQEMARFMWEHRCVCLLVLVALVFNLPALFLPQVLTSTDTSGIAADTLIGGFALDYGTGNNIRLLRCI